MIKHFFKLIFFSIFSGFVLLSATKSFADTCKYYECDYGYRANFCESIQNPISQADCNSANTLQPVCRLKDCPSSCIVQYESVNCYYRTESELVTQCTQVPYTYTCQVGTGTCQNCSWKTVCTESCSWVKRCPTCFDYIWKCTTTCSQQYSCVPYSCPIYGTCTGYNTSCSSFYIEVPHCKAIWSEPYPLACTPPTPPPVCNVTSCTPSCPSGQVPYNTGGSSAPSATCTYQTGGTNSNGTCTTATNSTSCWYDSVPPNVVIEGENSTTPLGCTVPNTTIGTEGNNTTKITTTYQDLSSSDRNTALMLWFSTTSSAPSISKVYDNEISGKLLSNDSFGILIRKVNGSWSDIYIPSVDAGSLVWTKAGTVGSGLRAEILSKDSTKMIGIKDVSVTDTSNSNTMILKIEPYNELSGVQYYDKLTDGSYNIFAVSNRNSTFLPSGGTNISSVPAWKDSTKDINVDLNTPVVDTLTNQFDDSGRLLINWKFSDSHSSIIRSIGDASIAKAGKVNDTIDDITSGVTNYVLGSGDTGSQLYGGYHLWRVNNTANRTDTINLKNNEGGSLNFDIYGFDSACNYTNSSLNVPLGNAWMITKGGMVNTGSGSAFLLRALSGHEYITTDSYWGKPFSFYKDEADLSTELLSGGTETLNDLLHSATLKSVRITNNSDRNNRPNYWFAQLSKRAVDQITKSPASYADIYFDENVVLNGQATDISSGGVSCTSSKNCVVKINGDLRVNSGFSCDARAIFLASGNLRIEPDITASDQKYGCMFIIKGNATISDGTYKSSGSSFPKYDVVEAYILADGIINMPLADEAQTVRDGLKINGSILGFGDVDGASIQMGRSLRLLHNNSYPAVAVHFDNRYLPFAAIFFGGEREGFEREVGFKAL